MSPAKVMISSEESDGSTEHKVFTDAVTTGDKEKRGAPYLDTSVRRGTPLDWHVT